MAPTPKNGSRGRKQNASILDSVTQELAFFKKDLGAGDKHALDTYLENIREIERRIQIAMSKSREANPSSEIPFGLPENNHVHFKLMYDLMALAFEGDITRSATFMLGRDLSGASFPESGFNGGWHGSSHHGDKPDNVANYSKMNRYHVQNLAYFVEKLKNIPDGDGTLLDHILIYKGSNMGNSHRHAHEKVPVILLGGIDGKFKGNRHIVFPDNTERTSNMLLSILHLFGIEREKYRDEHGPAAAGIKLMMRFVPYLPFNGQCEAAFKLYAECFGGKIDFMSTYAGSPMANDVPPEWRSRSCTPRSRSATNHLGRRRAAREVRKVPGISRCRSR